MKLNKKGFTLIELLAVIVILAVIALIATPLIMGTITKARKNSAVDSAYGYMKAVEQAVGEAQIEDPTGAFDISGKALMVKSANSVEVGTLIDSSGAASSDNWQALSTENPVKLTINYKGSEPSNNGVLVYDANGRVTKGTLEIGGYTVTITNDTATVN